MERRDMMKVLATMPLGAWALTPSDVADAAEHTHKVLSEQTTQPKSAFVPKFFSALEWHAVRVLADIVIPRDAKSGSATDAGVPEFMDYVMIEFPNNQTRIREGLGWLNAESRTRFGVPFADATAPQRFQIVDDIAWPAKAKPPFAQGARFFSAFRDLTASAFYTSRIGVKDIGYMGNIPQSAWHGCSPAAEKKLGVS